MGEVRALNPGDNLDKGALAQLANDPRLEGFMIVCMWDDGASTVGWSTGLKHKDLVYGAQQLEHDVEKRVFFDGD